MRVNQTILTFTRRRVVAGLIALAGLGATGAAHAQPALEAPAPAPIADAPATIALYDHAMEVFVRGDYAVAAREFAEVARTSTDASRRAASEELARQAARRAGAAPAAKLSVVQTDELQDEDSGRAAFLANTILLGLNYGWFVPVILDIDDPKAFVGVSLLTAGASFVLPYLATRDDHITRGMSTLGGAGASFGLGHGALLYGALAGEDGFDDSDGVRVMLASMLGLSVAEGTLGYLWARESRLSAGTALALSSGSLWGLAYAAGGNILVSGDEPNARAMMGSMLLGSAAGLGGAWLYQDRRRTTEGDASLVSFTGLLGTYAVFAPLLIAETDDPRVVAGSLMAGATVGLVVGDRLVATRDYSRGQAGLVALGSMGGGLLGAGAAFIVTPDDAELGKWVVSGGVVGAVGAAAVMLSVIEPEPETAASGLSVQLAPLIGPERERGLALSGRF